MTTCDLELDDDPPRPRPVLEDDYIDQQKEQALRLIELPESFALCRPTAISLYEDDCVIVVSDGDPMTFARIVHDEVCCKLGVRGT